MSTKDTEKKITKTEKKPTTKKETKKVITKAETKKTNTNKDKEVNTSSKDIMIIVLLIAVILLSTVTIYLYFDGVKKNQCIIMLPNEIAMSENNEKNDIIYNSKSNEVLTAKYVNNEQLLTKDDAISLAKIALQETNNISNSEELSSTVIKKLVSNNELRNVWKIKLKSNSEETTNSYIVHVDCTNGKIIN